MSKPKKKSSKKKKRPASADSTAFSTPRSVPPRTADASAHTSRSRRRWLWAGVATVVVAAGVVAALYLPLSGSTSSVPTDWPRLQVQGAALPLYVARTPAERDAIVPPRPDPQRSLTRWFDRFIEPTGVLFAYPEDRTRFFQFDPTWLPGSQQLLWLDKDGKILESIAIQGAAEEILSRGPARFALFVPGSWWTSRAIQPGGTLDLPPDVARGAEPDDAPPDWPRLAIKDQRLPVHVARRRAEREALVPPQIDPRRPLTAFFRKYRVPVGVLLAYPDESLLTFHFDNDQLNGSQTLLLLDGRGTVQEIVAIERSERVVLANRPARFALAVPTVWWTRHAVAQGAALELPPAAREGVEPEYTPLPDSADIRVGAHPLHVELAYRTAPRTSGLMYRHDVPENTGMLFLFPRAREQHFWMRNTRVALDIAYIDENLVIRNIVTMVPHDLDQKRNYTSRGPVVYCLETRAGWFRDHGVKAGDRIEVDDSVRARQQRADP